MVAQVYEAQAAQVASDVGPAAQGHGLPDQGLVDQAAEMGTHGVSSRGEQPIILAVAGAAEGARPLGGEERERGTGNGESDAALPVLRRRSEERLCRERWCTYV